MLKVSFAKMSTKGTFKAQWPYGTDLYGRFLYLESGKEQALIAAFDFNGSYPKEAARWRREVSKRTGIPEKSIWFHELQIHAAPFFDQLAGESMDALIERSCRTVEELMANARECDCYAAECDMGTDFSFNREQYVEGLGGVTVWRGIEFDKNGTPYTSDPSIMLLRGYTPQLPAFEQGIVFDNNVDQMGYVFVFRAKDGTVLGSVTRFAAHPDVAVLFEHSKNPDRSKEYHYDYDWPGYLADDMSEHFGGVGMYINGPCADLAAKKDCSDADTYEKSARECKRLAKIMGERLRTCFENKNKKLDTALPLKTELFSIPLPLKEDIPHSYEEINALAPVIESKQKELDTAILEGAEPWRIKKLIDDRWRIGYIPHNFRGEEYSFSSKELSEHILSVDVSVMTFGGYLFVGVPGESMVDITLWLRSRFTGTKTIPVDQVGGYYNYMATPRSMTLGGYTYWSSWVRRDGIPILKKELAPLIDEFLES